MPDRLRYVVTIARGGCHRTEEMEARSPQLAARAAEAANPGWQSVAVAYQIAGRCGECGGYVFDGPDLQHRGGQLRCSDCP